MLGAIAYSLLLVAYAIVAGVTILWLISSGRIDIVTSPVPTLPYEAVAPAAEGSVGSILLEMLAYIITALMLLTVTFVVVSLPYWLGKSGSFLLKRTIRLFQWSVTPLTLLVGKIIACGVVMVPVSMFIMQDISNFLSLISIIVLVTLALFIFMLQHYLAKMTKIEAKQIW